MKYLIDTDWIVDYLAGQEEARKLLTTLHPDGIAISIVTFTEIYEGIYTNSDPRRGEEVF